MMVVAFYLPQFYSFPENDKWWGKDFTEWTNVKKSKPLWNGHYQPTIPLNNNFYRLDSIEPMREQVRLAHEYGVGGFCFYHYWFGENRQLMEKPVENYLKESSLDLPFCLCWANHNWSRTWVGGEKDILMDMSYGDEDEWAKHFNYLLKFFTDDRYIRIDNKPVLVIYLPQDIPHFDKWRSFMNQMAINNGLNGICFIGQAYTPGKENEFKGIDYFIEYEPNYTRFLFQYRLKNNILKNLSESQKFTIDMFMYILKNKIKKFTRGKFCKVNTISYDLEWEAIINRTPTNRKMLAGAFVKCDVTPRRQDRALIYKGDTPEKFEKYLKKLFVKIKEKYSKNILFVSAWNEWGEGMYLEPDEKFKYAYLESLRAALKAEECWDDNE